MIKTSDAGSVLGRCQAVPASYPSGVGLDLDVQVRRQDTTVETVKLHQEYERFIQTEIPDFQKEYLQFPEVFAPKVKDSEKAIEGFLQKHGSDNEVWLTHALGDKAESDVFYDVEKQFRNRTAVSYNGFQLGSLFKVAKETIKDDRNKRREQHNDILDVPLSNDERYLYRLLGKDPAELSDCVDGIVKKLFGEDDWDEIDKNRLKDNIDLITTKKKKWGPQKIKNKWVCKLLLRKIENLFKTQNIQRNLSKQEIHSFVINLIFLRNINKNQSLDQLLVDKSSSTVIQVEIKSVGRVEDNFHDKGLRISFTKACEQIGQGKEMFLRVLAPNSNLSSNWAYQGLVCFPNVSDKGHFERLKLSPILLDKIITRHELKAGNWLDFIKNVNRESTDEEYMKILSIIIGSAYVDVNSQIFTSKDDTFKRIVGSKSYPGVGGEMMKDEEKETPPAFQDLKGIHLGHIKSILFHSPYNLLKILKTDGHVAIAGDYGVGKTSLIVSFALTEAEDKEVKTYYISATSYDEENMKTFKTEVEYLLDIATKEKFSSSNVIVKSLSDIRQQLQLPVQTSFSIILQEFMKQFSSSNQNVFIDEYSISKDDLQKIEDNEDSELSTTLQCIRTNSKKSWISFRTGDLRENKVVEGYKFPSPNTSQMVEYLKGRAGYRFVQLELNMRNSSNIHKSCIVNITDYSKFPVHTPVNILPAVVCSPSTVAGQRPYCLLSPWSGTDDYTRIGTSLRYSMKTILKIPSPVTEPLAILCSEGISARQVAGVLAQFCSQTVALYDAGIEKFNADNGHVTHYQAGYDPVQQRAYAVTWAGQGGILVTHSALFSGMEANTVILITQRLGDGGQARSEILRSVAKLVVITDSESVIQENISNHFNIIHVSGDEDDDDDVGTEDGTKVDEQDQDGDDTNDFKTLIVNQDTPLFFSGRDVKIYCKSFHMIRMRSCPQEEYDDFTDALKIEADLCPASPIIQIEDFDSLISDSCTEIHIRHNLYNWRKYQKCHLRSYSCLQSSLSYIEIEAEIFEDYIKVCGHTKDEGKKETKDIGSISESSRAQQINNQSGRSRSNDEGYGQHDGGPKLNVSSLVLVTNPEDICGVRLYFAREKNENRCPDPHDISIYAVLDKKSTIEEFLENELNECEFEQGATRIRVSIYHDQTYTPKLGESTKEKPEIIWEEAITFSSFSYRRMNQKKGYLRIPKRPPPLTLFCDRRKYTMIQLITNSSQKPPDDPIYTDGDNIITKSCQKYHDKEKEFGCEDYDDKQYEITEDIEEVDEQSMITEELCTIQDSVIIAIRDVASAICLISWKEHTEENKKEKIGTAFLCSLPKNLGYKAVLLSAGHNFIERELTQVGQEGYPYKDFSLLFYNIKGIPNEKQYLQKNETEVKLFNLAYFLSKCDTVAVKHLYSDSESNHHDYVVFDLGITKEEIKARFNLTCLPVATHKNDENIPQALSLYGHPAPGEHWNENDELPLCSSNGTRWKDEELLEMLDKDNANQVLQKKVKIAQKKIESKLKIFYSNDTLPGSSGSPVLAVIKNDDDNDTTLKVVGIHNGGLKDLCVQKTKAHDGQTNKKRLKINYCHKMSDILKDFNENVKNITVSASGEKEEDVE